MTNCTILLKGETRDRLKMAGHKGQTYDQIIEELLDQKKPKEAASL